VNVGENAYGRSEADQSAQNREKMHWDIEEHVKKKRNECAELSAGHVQEWKSRYEV
jgi:hypothetical protein